MSSAKFPFALTEYPFALSLSKGERSDTPAHRSWFDKLTTNSGVTPGRPQE